MSLDKYLAWAFNQPNLSHEEEKSLLQSLKADNNLDAAKKLVIRLLLPKVSPSMVLTMQISFKKALLGS